ncbi:unnamed protein product [Prunus armeniaca]|uniref:Uncharacterized protein n=1 Tax=Prunus armeniaca TaxID=36596 RepID=A0A6J5W802_PRUAR|nr:unnamed protein product [Prunus armeniaca]
MSSSSKREIVDDGRGADDEEATAVLLRSERGRERADSDVGMGECLGQEDVLGRMDCLGKSAAHEGKRQIMATNFLGHPQLGPCQVDTHSLYTHIHPSVRPSVRHLHI